MRACPIPPRPKDLITRIKRPLTIKTIELSKLMRGLSKITLVSFGILWLIGFAYQHTMLFHSIRFGGGGFGTHGPNPDDPYMWQINYLVSRIAIPENLWVDDKVTIKEIGFKLVNLDKTRAKGVKITFAVMVFPPGFDLDSMMVSHPSMRGGKSTLDFHEEFAIYAYRVSHNFTYVGEKFYTKLKVALENTKLNLKEGESVELKCITAQEARIIYKNGSLSGPATAEYFSDNPYLLVKNPDFSDRIQRNMNLVGGIGLIVTGSLVAIKIYKKRFARETHPMSEGIG